MRKPRFTIKHKRDKTFVLYDENGLIFEEDFSKIFSVYSNWQICRVCGEVITAKSPDELFDKVKHHEHDLTFIYKDTPKVRFRRGVLDKQDNDNII